jgi:hypothetical protein
MIYRLNGKFFSTLQGLGVSLTKPVVTITEAQRKQIQKLEIATGMPAQRGTAQEQIKKLYAQTPYGAIQTEADRRKTLPFAELDRLFQAENWEYARLAGTIPINIRQKAWERLGRPTAKINWGTLMTYAKKMYQDWERSQQIVADARATVSAAAKAVQAFQAANPQIPQQDLVASAARVVVTSVPAGGGTQWSSAAPAAAAPAEPAPAAAQPVAAVPPPEEGAGPTALSLLAAGAWLLFG